MNISRRWRVNIKNKIERAMDMAAILLGWILCAIDCHDIRFLGRFAICQRCGAGRQMF